MQFDIIITTGSIKYLLHVERIATGKGFERFRVTPKNNPDKYIIIQNNRPLIRIKLNLKHKPLTWTIKEGEVHDQRNYERMIQAVEKVLEPPPPVVKKSETIFNSMPTNRKKKPKGGTTLGDRMKG